MKKAEIYAVIDEPLRLTLFGLQSILQCGIDGKEIERVFADAESDQVSEKHYEFLNGTSAKIHGVVLDYEPETILIIVESKGIDQQRLNSIYQDAEIDVRRRTTKQITNRVTE